MTVEYCTDVQVREVLPSVFDSEDLTPAIVLTCILEASRKIDASIEDKYSVPIPLADVPYYVNYACRYLAAELCLLKHNSINGFDKQVVQYRKDFGKEGAKYISFFRQGKVANDNLTVQTATQSTARLIYVDTTDEVYEYYDEFRSDLLDNVKYDRL